MSAKSAHLTLRPDRCNECGRCVAACPNDAIRVGADYILVDWHACNQCSACVAACDRNAIIRAMMPARSTDAAPSFASTDVSKVVVGSRAEAKAVRKAAKQAAKQAGRGGGRVVQLAAPARAVPSRATPAIAVAASPAAVSPAAAPAAAAPAPRVATTPSAQTRAADDSPPSPAHWSVLGATWTFVDAAVVLALLLVTLVAKAAILAVPAVALMPAAGRAFTRAGVLALYYGVQIGGVAFLARRHGCNLMEAFGLRQSSDSARASAAERPSVAVTALLTVGMLVGVEVVAITYGLIAQAVGWRQPLTLSADVATVFGGGGVGFALSILLVALVAPLAEEFAFRGVILPAIGQRWGQWPAILISAALFAAYHVNLWLFVPMLVLGTALGWLTTARRSLWPAIALHVLYNSIAVVAAFTVPR